MREITKKWLEAASLDIESITHILNHDRLTGHVAFHAQQAIEKALKASMEEFEIRVPKIHSLSKLYNLCTDLVELRIDEDIIIALDSLYVESRYPGEFGLLPEGKPTQKQAQLFFDFALEIFLSVQKQLENK